MRVVTNTVALGALLILAACDGPPQEATGARQVPDAQAGLPRPMTDRIVKLTAEEAARGDVAVQPVERGAYRDHRDYPGTVTPNEYALAEITTLVRGRVVDVYADVGQEVKTGALLAILYSSDLGMAQSAYLKANAKLYVAERSYQRATLLLQEKVIGLAEAQRREGDMISARAEAREARDRLVLLGMAEPDIQRLAKEQTIRSYVPISAPFNGRVIARNLTRGEVVETTEKLFVVADLSKVWVLANIPEKDIPFVPRETEAEADQVEVRLTAYPEEVFHGRITYVGDVLNVSTRTMRLRLELENPDRKLKPEMYAMVRIYSKPEENVLMVPETAVQRDRDKRFVFVQVEPNTYEAREVKVRESNGDVVQVADGLQEGELVVSKGAFVLKSELMGEQI